MTGVLGDLVNLLQVGGSGGEAEEGGLLVVKIEVNVGASNFDPSRFWVSYDLIYICKTVFSRCLLSYIVVVV